MKLTKKKTNYLLLTIVVGFLTTFVILPSCKKDKPDTNPDTGGGTSNCDEIENVKDYFAFKVGSWWVYEEENSGVRDSLFVTEFSEDSSNYNFNIRIYSTFQGYYYHLWPEFAYGSQQCKESGVICTKCVELMRSKYKPGDYLGEDVFFLYMANKGDFVYSTNPVEPNNKIIIDDVFETYNNGSNSFNKTYKVYEPNTYVEGEQPTYHYYAKNVGLVRKELLDSGQVWNLINYYIAI